VTPCSLAESYQGLKIYVRFSIGKLLRVSIGKLLTSIRMHGLTCQRQYLHPTMYIMDLVALIQSGRRV